MFSNEYTWITLALLIVIALILWKGLGPIFAMLDARAARIRKEIDEAQSLREEAQKLLAEYNRRQREGQAEAQQIVEHARVEAERIRANSARELDELMARREALSIEKIRQAEQEAVAEVRAKAVDLAIAAAKSLIESNLDEARQRELIQSGIAEVGRKLH